MTEADLKDELCKVLRYELKGAIVFRHEDKYTAGIPDISITWKSVTIWLEVKYANPVIHQRALQTLTCMRLANQGLAWIIIYERIKDQKKTIITNPRNVMEGSIEETPDEWMATGFDHLHVSNFIRSICGDYIE